MIISYFLPFFTPSVSLFCLSPKKLNPPKYLGRSYSGAPKAGQSLPTRRSETRRTAAKQLLAQLRTQLSQLRDWSHETFLPKLALFTYSEFRLIGIGFCTQKKSKLTKNPLYPNLFLYY